MLRRFFAPRLNQDDAASIAGLIARIAVQEKLTDLKFIEKIEDLLAEVVDNHEKYKNYKISNGEAVLIAKQARFNLGKYRDQIEEHLRRMSIWHQQMDKTRRLPNRREIKEVTEYLDDKTLLSSFRE